MSAALRLRKLTEEQEDYVWQLICLHMTDEDRNPIEAIQEDYNGDRSRYLREMAGIGTESNSAMPAASQSIKRSISASAPCLKGFGAKRAKNGPCTISCRALFWF